jgi:cytochrome c biogenesis protein CcmG/thiol:disulfide interchange protein DsbE
MKRLYVILGIFVLLCGGLLWVLLQGFGRNPHAVPFMLRGKPAPTFNVRRMDTGERVTLDHFKGRPLVINFWASWCQPCKYEHPVLEWGHRAFSNQVQFLAVTSDDDEELAKAALQRLGGSLLLHTIDQNGSMSVDYGTSGVPETYFVDASGIIRDKHIGPIDPDSLRIQIEALQKPAPSAEATK